MLQSIHELGVKAGLAINLGTPLSTLEEVLDMVEVVQVTTVNPGFGGQPFIHSQLDKVRRLRQMLDERRLTAPMAVDGGIDTTTALLAVGAGATVPVSGTNAYK